MPRFDGTGPEGQGSKTGRGLGKCNPKEASKNEADVNEMLLERPRSKRGGRGQGRKGRGFGNRIANDTPRRCRRRGNQPD